MNDSIITAAVVPDKYALTEEGSLDISEDCVEYYDCSVGSNWEMIHGAIE